MGEWVKEDDVRSFLTSLQINLSNKKQRINDATDFILSSHGTDNIIQTTFGNNVDDIPRLTYAALSRLSILISSDFPVPELLNGLVNAFWTNKEVSIKQPFLKVTK
jgi:hypothetical protein